MSEHDPIQEQVGAEAGAEIVLPAQPLPIVLPYPFIPPASGLYETRQFIFQPIPLPTPVPIEPQPIPISRRQPWSFYTEELRLDVDGRYPQMVASGAVHGALVSSAHWIANLQATGASSWTGAIWYKDGSVGYTNVAISVNRSWYASQRTATVTFSGGGQPDRVRTFQFKSPYYHAVEFEFDCAQGEAATTQINTCAHPNRPASMPCETLSIQNVYQRAGFDVTISSAGSVVPLAGAGANARWSDQEMHDAMQTYWSRFAAKSQWALWAFFASLHEQGTSLGGIMFDDIGANHRQGTAIFNDSFIANAPAGDANPTAWVNRMIFWTACHEIGHCFNLAHSWQKQHPPSWGTPWIPLANEPEARSFMNYPYNVSGGQTAFFANFEYRFSDGELLFMRHAPGRFVQMGNADWFDQHGFQEAAVSLSPPLRLEIRANRERPVFEFMEPVTLELKLTNVCSEPQLVDERLLSSSEALVVIVKKDGKPARQYVPYAQYCWSADRRALLPGESMYDSLFISAGRNGWDLAEPGNYTVQVALRLEQEDIVSNELRLRVTPPRAYDEEYLAQDLFSDDVGRIIAFEGSRFFERGNDVLREVAAKLSDRRVALHASLALGGGLAFDHKQLVEDPKEPRKHLGIKVEPPKVDEARELLDAALIAQAPQAVESFGHVSFRRRVDEFSAWLAEQGAEEQAFQTQDALLSTMSARQVGGRPILPRVLADIEATRDAYKPGQRRKRSRK